MFGLSDDCPVSAKGVAIKFFYSLYDVRTKGIQVYVADQRKKVIVFVAKYGFIPVFEQMSGTLMAAIKV